MLSKAIYHEGSQKIIDAYAEALSGYDVVLMVVVLREMMHNWTSQFNKVPTVADIVQSYRNLKNSRSNKEQIEKSRSLNNGFFDKKNNGKEFWGKYKKMRERGVESIGEILKGLGNE